MRKSLLELYMQKVADGDGSYLDKLCSQLADRLIFAPVVSSASPGKGGESRTTFSVLRINEGHRSLVPIFTSERRFKDWSEKNNHTSGSISLLGGDFCAALSAETWVLLDPGAQKNIELEPLLVKRISQSGLAEEAYEDSEEAAPREEEPSRALAGKPATSNIVRQAMFSNAPETNEYLNSYDQMGKPPPNKPGYQDEKAAPPAEKTYSDSRLTRSAMFANDSGPIEGYTPPSSGRITPPQEKPVIFSTAQKEEAAPQEDDKKKKKSFLSFLKGS